MLNEHADAQKTDMGGRGTRVGRIMKPIAACMTHQSIYKSRI